ncbi:MAG TPA: lipid A biosynthesis acyltransferase [Anaeromyxobacter sp.]|nr:lipid A biosynthesis acyltransferase [Anaeromyxobacter sp.]
MSVPVHKQVKRSVRSVLLRLVIRLFAHVPLRLALAIGTLAASIGWRTARKTRAQMLAQLAIAFPEKPEAEREAIARASLRHLAWLAAEVATLGAWRGRLASYVSFAPGAEERFRALAARGKGLVFVTGHVGNWELLAQRIAADHPSYVIARAGNDSRITEIVGKVRAEGNVETLWREDPSTARALIRCFKQGRPLGILIDQDTNVQGVFVPFFGRPAHTPRGAADLALRFGAPVAAGWARRRGPEPGAGHVLDFVDVPYDPEPRDREAEVVRLTAACTAALEAAIRRNPVEWVWMHERWKTRPERADEPTQAKAMPETADLSSR